MALIKCKDCGKDVSTLAASCPNCGRPVDEQQLPLPDPCPDEDCTGTLNEDGECGTCGKPADWRYDEEIFSTSFISQKEGYVTKWVTLAQEIFPASSFIPKKPHATKMIGLVLVLTIGILVVAFVHGDMTQKSGNPKPSSVAPSIKQNAPIAIDQTAHEKAECTASVESMKAEYGKLMSEKKYWDAGHQANSIEQCAKTLQDKSLEAWADDASVQSYVQAIKDPKTSIPEKMNLIELFKQFHPDKAQPYVSMLPDLQKEWDSPKKTKSVTSGMVPEKIDVGTLIKRVIAGENLNDREFIVTGVALSKGKEDDGLLNLATQATYNSGSYLNFISVLATNVAIKEGAVVQVMVRVVSSESRKINGVDVVLISADFLGCYSCSSRAKK